MNIGLLIVVAVLILVAGHMHGASVGFKRGRKSGMVDGNLEGRKQLAHERAVYEQQQTDAQRRAREEAEHTAAASVRDVEPPTPAAVPEVLAQNTRAIQSLGSKRPKSRPR